MLDWREIWKFRYFLQNLVARDLKVKYKRSVLGFLWTFINPLLMVTILVMVFRLVVRIQMEGYWAFILSGYFVWNTISTTIYASTYTLQEHGPIARNVAFPKEIVLLSAVMTRMIEFSLEITLVTAALLIMHHGGVPAPIVLLPVLLLVQFVLSLGIALPVSILSVLFSDVQHALPVILTGLFYFTPIFYPVSFVPEGWRNLWYLNPFAPLLTSYQAVLYHGIWPARGDLIALGVHAVFWLLVGGIVFRSRREVISELV